MSDAAASPSISSTSSDSAAAETALVSFENDASVVAVEFTDAPPSEWSFAAHEAPFDGEAVDTMRESDSAKLTPLVAVATFAIAEAELYADAEDALVAMTPAPFTFEITGSANGTGAEVGMVMWSGDIDGVAEPIASYARGETGLVLHDIAPHGISLDWTDTLLG